MNPNLNIRFELRKFELRLTSLLVTFECLGKIQSFLANVNCIQQVWSMKWRVSGQKVDQRKLGERLWKDSVKCVDWIIVDGGSRYGYLLTMMGVSG